MYVLTALLKFMQQRCRLLQLVQYYCLQWWGRRSCSMMS
jgi:hypothetical protein